MNNNPVVSICCICYNQEKYIRETLDGFLMQKTSFPYEIVVSDDCSKDQTRDVIEEYKNKYPDKIRDVSPLNNKGVLSNWWYVQSEAKGKYIALCEGDDYWTDPLKIQKQVDFLDAHPDYSMCFHGAKLKVENEGQTTARCEYVQTKEYTSNELKQEWIVPTASILYRLDVQKKTIKNSDWLLYGDISLILQCAEHGRVMGFEDKMSVYRVNGGGVTQSRRPSLERAIKHDKCLYINFPKARNAVGLSLAGHYYTLGHNSKSFVDKIKNILLSFRYSPKYVSWKLLSVLLGKDTKTAEAGVVK